jgi:hypothetical protein
MDLFTEVRAVHHELLGHTSDVDAGAAHGGVVRRPVVGLRLADGDARAVASGHAAQADAGGASAKDEQIEIVLRVGVVRRRAEMRQHASCAHASLGLSSFSTMV